MFDAEYLEKAEVLERTANGGPQVLLRFPNGYGASVTSNRYSFGLELAVIYFLGPGILDFDLEYGTPITDDVVGHLDAVRLNELLYQIYSLPPR